MTDYSRERQAAERMRGDWRCMWWLAGVPVCGKPATHGTLVGEGTYYLCAYHAGRAKRDGWRGVKPLKGAVKI